MSENDYIAEYVKERHPHILGMDFALWKMAKMFENAMQKVADTLFQVDWSQVDWPRDEDEKDEDVVAVNGAEMENEE